MKTTYFLMTLLIMLSSCSSQEKEAQENIEKYLKGNIREGNNISFEKFSKLYILHPKNKEKIPTFETGNQEEILKAMNLYSSELKLSLSGCSFSIFEDIVKNDSKFREWNTGGNKFAMICFFKNKDKFLDETRSGVCLVLDSILKVSGVYSLKNEDAIFEKIEIN